MQGRMRIGCAEERGWGHVIHVILQKVVISQKECKTEVCLLQIAQRENVEWRYLR